MPGHPAVTPARVRELLLRRAEILLADVREEAVFAQGHPLWAANFPLSRLELDAWRRVPRRDTLIVVYGDAHAPADRAIEVLRGLGYTRVHALAGGLDGWAASGGEVFRDVNVPSKAFGELVESVAGTPSVPAEEVGKLIDAGQPPVIVDARRFDEYRTMSVPTATSVPGGELVLRIRELVPGPDTPVVVNCAGRTRSIIGAQSLINAGLPNPVAALRNGTIGWTLAGQELDRGAARTAPGTVTPAHRELARAGAQDVARRAGVRFAGAAGLPGLRRPDRTTYVFDVRTAEEYAAGHLPGSVHAPGGQLVQETDHWAPVRGARVVLVDDDGVRAAMTGSWLAQMGWETWAISPAAPGDLTARGEQPAPLPEPPPVDTVDAVTLRAWLDAGTAEVIDVGPSREYAAGHIPGAWFAVRARLPAALGVIGPADRYVVTSPTGELARFAAADLRGQAPVLALDGGTAAWRAVAPLAADGARYAVEPTDRYRRP